MYAATGGPNVKWGGTDFKWVAGHHWSPRWRRICCYVTFQPQFTPWKCCTRRQMSSLPPGYAAVCLHDRIISLCQVIHTAKYTKVEPSYKKYHIDIYFKTKTVVVHAANVEPSDIFLQAFNSVIRNFTGSSSQCFEAPTALSLLLMLSFYRINVEPIDLVKSNLS